MGKFHAPSRQLPRQPTVGANMAVHEGHGEFGDPHCVADLIDCLKKIAGEKGSISVGRIIDGLGTRTYGPMLAVPALLGISPVGAIPTAPTVIAIIVAIFAVQMLVGAHHFWVPDFIEKLRVPSDKLCAASLRLDPVAARLDRWFHGRLKGFASGMWVRIAALVALLLCLTVPPLEFIPFAAAAPLAAIAAIGLAMLVRDGALMLAAIVIGLAVIGFGTNEMLLEAGSK